MLRTLIQLILLIVILVLGYQFIARLPGSTLPLNLNISSIENLLISQNVSLSYPGALAPQNFIPQNQAVAYALSLINNDRNQYGLPNVTYSNITSGQQHAESMLTNDYFSHWDIYGLKPYMRYALLNGTGDVDENVAYVYNSSGVNVTNQIKQMEYNMMYNDEQCCNNGHRFNILNPQHNQVSIGVAYNRTTVFFVEDFINNYITWLYGTPSYNNGTVQLKGRALSGYYLSNVEINYDTPIINMTRAELDNTSSYGLGQNVAGIGHKNGNQVYYFPNITTINATTYLSQGSSFDVDFNMNNLIAKTGAGEYTVLVLLTNNTNTQQNNCFTDSSGIQHCDQFVGATYTVFINNNGQNYIPENV